MKTYSPKASQITRKWHLIDLNHQVLGRAATEIASLLQGKHKTYYSPHLDCGDYVVVTNAQKIKLTGNKLTQKKYFRHSGYPGGAKEIPVEKLIHQNPRQIIELAVKGMLPKNKLRQPRILRLKVFADNRHSYQDKFVAHKEK